MISELMLMLSDITRRDVTLELSEDDEFLRVLGLDSFDAVQLTVLLNDRYGIDFGAEAEDLYAFESLKALVALVERRRPKNLGAATQ